MRQPYIVTIILNTNRLDDTLECLASLAENTYKHHHTIVLDNASTDGSIAAIRNAFPWVEVIALDENLGYAGNNNVGIKAALDRGADWVLVLNEDTILAPDCLARLIEGGESEAGVGIVGPLVLHHDEPTIIQSAGGKLTRFWNAVHIGQNEHDTGQFVHPHSVDWISGCAILLRREVIERVGMLDERFFYYWEETEWCIRTTKAGWCILHIPMAKIWHKGVQRDYHPKPSVSYYATRNRFLVLMKHQAPFMVWAIVWAQTLRTLASYTFKPRWRSKRAHRDAIWHGTTDFLRRHWGRASLV